MRINLSLNALFKNNFKIIYFILILYGKNYFLYDKITEKNIK